jgi:CheY-like chemotaxis protein
MGQVICFYHSAALAHLVRTSLAGSGYELTLLPAAQLNQHVRALVLQQRPAIALLELDLTLDSAHLLFFLRADQGTRRVPIVLLSTSARLDYHAAVLEADGHLRMPFSAEQLIQTIKDCGLSSVEAAA